MYVKKQAFDKASYLSEEQQKGLLEMMKLEDSL